MEKIKKATLDLAMDWAEVHGWDFYKQFSEYEWAVATQAVRNMGEFNMKYREAVKKAYEKVNREITEQKSA